MWIQDILCSLNAGLIHVPANLAEGRATFSSCEARGVLCKT